MKTIHNTTNKPFTLKSNDIAGQATIKQLYYDCGGDNISPELEWTTPPPRTESFAITLYDPNAPTGSGWWHWIIFDIPANIRKLPENAGNPKAKLIPENCIQSINNFDQYGYSGPCPPPKDGIHAYIFTIYALKTKTLGLNANTNPAMVGFNLHTHTLQKASLIMYYQRK